MPDPAPSSDPARKSALRGLDAARIFSRVLGEETVAAMPAVAGWRLLREVGRGGMARVFLAHREADNAEAALKIASPRDDSIKALDEARMRFSDEAALLGQLTHPGIVRALGSVETADGLPVLILEYLAGGSLPQHLPERGFAQPEAVRIFCEVADAVAAAHAQGVVHRDLKPSNLLFTAEGAVKVADFGLAQPLAERVLAFSLTRSGAIAGTVEYLAPECYAPGAEATPAADQYALGVLLYELLTGLPPRGRWPAASEVRPVDLRLSDVLERAMAPEPAQRFPSVRVLLDEVKTIAATTPRLSARMRETRSLRATDAIWTLVGLSLLWIAVATMLVASQANVNLPFAFFRPPERRAIGCFETAEFLLMVLTPLTLWPVARAWRMRGLSLVERLPAPFGLRLRAGRRLTFAWVMLAQIAVLWIPAAMTADFAIRGRINWYDVIVGYLPDAPWPRNYGIYQTVNIWSFINPPIDKGAKTFYLVCGDVNEFRTDHGYEGYQKTGFTPGWEPWSMAIEGGLIGAGLLVMSGVYAFSRWRK